MNEHDFRRQELYEELDYWVDEYGDFMSREEILELLECIEFDRLGNHPLLKEDKDGQRRYDSGTSNGECDAHATKPDSRPTHPKTGVVRRNRTRREQG